MSNQLTDKELAGGRLDLLRQAEDTIDELREELKRARLDLSDVRAELGGVSGLLEEREGILQALVKAVKGVVGHECENLYATDTWERLGGPPQSIDTCLICGGENEHKNDCGVDQLFDALADQEKDP